MLLNFETSPPTPQGIDKPLNDGIIDESENITEDVKDKKEEIL